MVKGDNDELKVLGVIFVAAIIIVALYIFLKALFIIGIVAILAGVFIFVYGAIERNTAVAFWGAVIFIGGAAVSIIGYAGVDFFENTPTGQTLLDGSNKVIESGTETADHIANSYKSQAEITSAIQNSVLESVNRSG